MPGAGCCWPDNGRYEAAGPRWLVAGGVPARFLQFDEEAVCGCGPGVGAGMFLGVQPAGLPRLQLHVGFPFSRPEASGEGAQRDHHAVRMGMDAGAVSGAVAVLKDADPLVLENQPVVLRIHYNGIGHGKPLSGFSLWDISTITVRRYHKSCVRTPQ